MQSCTCIDKTVHLSRSLPKTSAVEKVIYLNEKEDREEIVHTKEELEKFALEEIKEFSVNTTDEVGFLGSIWRGILKSLILSSYSPVNGLQLARALQDSVQFISSHEGFIITRVMAALDSGDKVALRLALKAAFSNRNSSRIIVQSLDSNFDFIWHTHNWLRWNRWYDGFGQIPIIGFTGFPASENFPSTRDHAVASFFRIVLGRGSWLTRTLTGFEELTTFDDNFVAQNLGAESNGFETANRNQVGTYFGRQNTNKFRMHHRLPADESIVRTFMSSPSSTLVNNGIEHVLLCLGQHWNNMIYQFSGNFSHQRMEQLNPFLVLRFHMVVTIVTIVSLRGLSQWDARVLAPFVKKLQLLKVDLGLDSIRILLQEMKSDIIGNLCGGVESKVYALTTWVDAIEDSLVQFENEASAIASIVNTCRDGVELALDLITEISWDVPNQSNLRVAIENVCADQHSMSTNGISRHSVLRAMNLLSPKDKRTLIELKKGGMINSEPAQLLVGRVITLLNRELRRDTMNDWISENSMGAPVGDVQLGEVYWLQWDRNPTRNGSYVFQGQVTGGSLLQFCHRMTGNTFWVDIAKEELQILQYIAVAESIVHAQKAFMQIELDHGKRFSYFAFMELPDLQRDLRNLQVISQAQCSALDDTKLVLLKEAKEVAASNIDVDVSNMKPGKTYYIYENSQYIKYECTRKVMENDPEYESLSQKRIVKVPPQNLIIVGGGPCGLLSTLHCAENVVSSNGQLRLYESRDAFIQGGATFERAQIIRLDARWIAMLRYHLGTIYEDVFIPSSGETDSHYGNTLPTQGFIEITIKDLEAMMHLGVSKLDSMGLVEHVTKSGAQYNHKTNELKKKGSALKENDLVLLKYDYSGNVAEEDCSWRVAAVNTVEPLNANQVEVGTKYSIWIPKKRKLYPYTLIGVNVVLGSYQFRSMDDDMDDVICENFELPSVYPYGTKGHSVTEDITFEALRDGSDVTKEPHRMTFPFSDISDNSYVIDTSHTHVFEAIGKQHNSPVHFSATTHEPYGVCCITGMKVGHFHYDKLRGSSLS